MFIRGLGLMTGYLFTYFIASKYGASVNGLVALGFSLLMFVGVLGRLGIDINLVKFYANSAPWKEEPGMFYKVLLKSFLFSVVLALILYLCRDFFVVYLFEKPQLEPYIFWVCLTIPCWVAIRVCSGLLRAKRLTNWFAFFDAPGRYLFSLGFFFLLWSFVDNPINAIKAHFFGIATLMLLSLVIAIKHLETVSFKTKQNSWVFLKDAYPMMLSGAIIVFLGWADTFILGIFASEKTVGIYFIALKIAALAGFTLEGINAILMPQLAKYYKEENTKQYKKLIRFSTYLNFTLTVMVVLFIVIFNKRILGLFGEEFIVGSSVLIILLVGQVINSFSGSTGLILQMTGYQKVYQHIVTIALFINILLNLVLTPIYGAVGTAIATVISLGVWNISAAVFIKRKLHIESYFNPFTLVRK